MMRQPISALMIGRNVPLERKLIEQRGLLNSLMFQSSHND
jgi:hypothetical protein